MSRNDMKTIDLHGMFVNDAKALLEREITKAPENIRRIKVIHGSNNGTALRDMVRKRIRSPRIEAIVPTFSNDGETIIYLK